MRSMRFHDAATCVFGLRFLALSLVICASCMPVAGQPGIDTCDAGAIFAKVNTQLAEHQYEAAASHLDQLQMCPGLSDLQLFEVGWLYGRARHFDAALKIFNRVPEGVPDRATH